MLQHTGICSSVTNDLQWLCEELLLIAKDTNLLYPMTQWQRTAELVLPIIISKTQLTDLQNDAKNMLLDCSLGNTGCMNLVNGFFSNQYGMCITIKAHSDFKVQASGSAFGLNMLLDVNLDEYLSTSDSIGVKVFIHKPTQHFDMENSGILASVGSRTAIALKLVNITKLGAPYGECYSTGQIKSSYYFSDSYSLTGCMKTCQQKLILEQCECFLFGYGTSSSESKYCWQDSFKCAMNVLQQTTDDSGISIRNCGCIPTCNEVQYLATISSATWPSPYSTYSVICGNGKEICNRNPTEYHRYNSLKLQIFYDTLNYNQYKERPDYTLTDLFSDFGTYICMDKNHKKLGIVCFCVNYDFCRRKLGLISGRFVLHLFRRRITLDYNILILLRIYKKEFRKEIEGR